MVISGEKKRSLWKQRQSMLMTFNAFPYIINNPVTWIFSGYYCMSCMFDTFVVILTNCYVK